MTRKIEAPPRRPPALALALVCAAVLLAGCKAFDINVGTQEPIKLDPIKIDLNMRVDVYQYTGTSEEEQQAAKNVEAAGKRQRDRMAEIQTLKDNRFIGEDHLGHLAIITLPAADYGQYVEKTVREENADRDILMEDKAKAPGTDLSEVQEQLWLTRSDAAFEGELIEVAGDAPGSYVFVPKKRQPTQPAATLPQPPP